MKLQVERANFTPEWGIEVQRNRVAQGAEAGQKALQEPRKP
jgi:hypothetical protein